MVTTNVVVFEAICRGSLNWRVVIDGQDEPIPYANRDSCVNAARERARSHYLTYNVTTEVWRPEIGGRRECVIRFMTNPYVQSMVEDSDSSQKLREACHQFGSWFPCL